MAHSTNTPVWWTMRPRDIAALIGVIVVLSALAWWLTQPKTMEQFSTAPPSPIIISASSSAPIPPSSLPQDSEHDVLHSASPAPTAIAVHVVGAVTRPGVVELSPGSRAEAAINAAGGFTDQADERSINLAQPLTDGQQLIVAASGEPIPPPPGAPGPVSGTAKGNPDGQGRISINTASQEELEALPGVGPKTAEAIVGYRQEHGPFTAVDHLEAVPGIGRKTVDRLRDYLRP
ncbi:ComEA family DNA-binding protein [Stomatohabitans albus]|uniref:ComEA family DNA-binding protein n=1 Tax=Stomatohabitans albus TaxID=3110766 RepID=UPI00300DA5E5